MLSQQLYMYMYVYCLRSLLRIHGSGCIENREGSRKNKCFNLRSFAFNRLSTFYLHFRDGENRIQSKIMAESNEGDAGSVPTLGEHQLERIVRGSIVLLHGDEALLVQGNASD